MHLLVFLINFMKLWNSSCICHLKPCLCYHHIWLTCGQILYIKWNYHYRKGAASENSKNITLVLVHFSQKLSLQEYFRSEPRILNVWFGKTALQERMCPMWLYVIYMGNFLGPAEVNDNCVTRTCAGTVDRGFIVLAKWHSIALLKTYLLTYFRSNLLIYVLINLHTYLLT